MGVYRTPIGEKRFTSAVYEGDDFLRLVNEHVKNRKSFKYRKETSFVILGPCSDGFIQPPVPDPLALQGMLTMNILFDFPKDPHVLNDLYPGQESLQKLFAETPQGVVILISTCCGNYSRRMEERLKKDFPQVSWEFPSTRDYCGFPEVNKLADDLVEMGILASA
jgi:hypothetical protein